MNKQQEESLKLENQLCFPLYAAARRVTGLYHPYLKPLGLTYTQYIVFLALWEKDHVTMGELGKELYLDNGTLTPLLKKMEKEGYVIRVRSKEDERVVYIDLTEKGKAMKEKCAEIPMKIGSCVSLKPEEAKALYSLLYETIDAIEKPQG